MPKLLPVNWSCTADEKPDPTSASDSTSCSASGTNHFIRSFIRAPEAAALPTTLVVHGVPSRMKLDAMFQVLETLGFPGDAFDFFKMPSRFVRGRPTTNLGYMFINCTSPQVAVELSSALFRHPLGRVGFESKVYCEPATVQGFDANVSLAVAEGKNRAVVRNGEEWSVI